jgi:hypothetical protein
MNYKTIREIIKSVSSSTDLEEIVSDYEKFERDGEIGDCKLRRIERICFRYLVGDDVKLSPTTWFLRITMESYKLLYEWEREKHNEFRTRITGIVNYY